MVIKLLNEVTNPENEQEVIINPNISWVNKNLNWDIVGSRLQGYINILWIRAHFLIGGGDDSFWEVKTVPESNWERVGMLNSFYFIFFPLKTSN